MISSIEFPNYLISQIADYLSRLGSTIMPVKFLVVRACPDGEGLLLILPTLYEIMYVFLDLAGAQIYIMYSIIYNVIRTATASPLSCLA